MTLPALAKTARTAAWPTGSQSHRRSRSLAVSFSCTGCPTAEPCQADDCETVSLRCGDGILGADEQCDDGNTVAGDGCAASCLIEAGYSCLATSPSICATVCGDGILAGAEECDREPSQPEAGCSPQCTLNSPTEPLCGDGIVDVSEQCDDANAYDGDGCSATCAVESGWACVGSLPSACGVVCGDGIIAGAEQCDDGTFNGGDGLCDADCTLQ